MPPFKNTKKELEEKLAELTARIDEIDEDLSAAAEDDWDDNAIEAEDDEVLDSVGKIALAEMRQIKFALSRIESGSYGTCAECGRDIAKERLEALPSTTKCMKCS